MAASSAALELPDLAAIRSAAERIAPHVHRTPVMTCGAIDNETGASLFFKCEHLQRVGAFKARGACNAVLSLDAAVATGDVAFSGHSAQRVERPDRQVHRNRRAACA